MTKIRYLLVLLFIGACIFGLFQVKFRVHLLHREVTELQKQLEHEKNSMHVLKAEWAYLNKPERLQALSEKFLNLSELKFEQIISQTDSLQTIDTAQNSITPSTNNNILVKASITPSNNRKPIIKKWRYRERLDLKERKKK